MIRDFAKHLFVGWTCSIVLLALRFYVWAWRRPKVTFKDPETGEDYLTRWFLDGAPDLEGRTGGSGWYLHFFHRSDWSRDLHNHPCWGVAWILDRGYVEERREGADGPLQFFNRHVGAMNVISLDTFHRTILFDEKAGSWSLFCMGPRVRKWGFLQSDGTIQRANHFDARTGESVPRS